MFPSGSGSNSGSGRSPSPSAENCSKILAARSGVIQGSKYPILPVMAKKTSPSKRSTDYLRDHYPFVEVVEKRVPYSFITIDLFHFADLIAFNYGEVVLVQTTTTNHMGARMEKIRLSAEARLWVLGEGRRLFIHGWSKTGPRGGVKEWTLREVEVTEDDFPVDKYDT